MKLRYKLADLPPEGLDLALDIPIRTAQKRMEAEGGETVSLAAPVTGRLKLEPAKHKIVVRGRIESEIWANCARCLEDFRLPVAEDLVVVYEEPPEGEPPEELEDGNLYQDYIVNETLDLWPRIEELLVLSVPMKPLCRQDCQGLCPTCGVNRNRDKCACRAQAGNPAFATLLSIRENLPE
ncbi:MAG: DUF177 domain-containing protein [Thermodesulfobacteriota bacterium]